MMEILLFIAGLALLISGAEMLVRGASRLALAFGIPPLVVGLTVVAFGTSSPELAVSVKAALSDQASIAVGNVVGSNIFNVLFILGLSALLVPLVVSQQLVRLDVPLMIALSAIVMILSLDGRLSHVDAFALVSALAMYIGWQIYGARKNSGSSQAPVAPGAGKTAWAVNLGLVIGGLVFLVLGSRWLLESAVAFAAWLGISELVIGLTIVAAGTSLPEVVTSVIAAIRKETDIAVGNVVGSNIFNISGVLGVAGMVAPGGIEMSAAVVTFDLPVMFAVAVACLPIFFTGGIISRPEGALLLAYYVVYTLYLIMAASHHDALSEFGRVVLYFVIPLTVVTLVTVVLRELRKGGTRSG